MTITRSTAAATLLVALTTSVAAACGTDDPQDPPAPPASAVDLTRPPDGVSWTTVGGVFVPVSSVDGPTSDPGAPFTGFTRTPQGAALAAIGQSVQLAVATDTRWPAVLAAVTSPGAGRDSWAANRALVSVSGTDPATAPDIAGYTVTDYSDAAARVTVIQHFPDDSWAATDTPLTWTGGDWKLTLDSAPGDDARNPVTALPAAPDDMVELGGGRR